jgi:hypothetical protein
MASILNADDGVVSGSAGLKSTADSSGVLALQTNGTTAVTVTAAGSVGLGTTSPTFLSGGGLEVYNSSVARLKLTNSTTGTASTDGLDIHINSTDANIIVRESFPLIIYTSNAERMRILSGGNVGIGTSSPATKLDVNGGITVNGSVLFNANGDSSSATGEIKQLTGSGLTIYSKTGSSYDFTLLNAGGSNLIRNPTGTSNVEFPQTGAWFTGTGLGIGTTSPVARNQIRGSGTSGQVTASWMLENASSGTAGMDITGTAGASYLRFLYGNGPSTGTNALTETMRIGLEGASVGVQQIKFAATQVASADANTLDDYEEGTFAPYLYADSGSGATYNGQTGKYTKIGNVVHYACILSLTSKGTMSGSLYLAGLPFEVETGYAGSAEPWGLSISHVQGLATSVYSINGWSNNVSTIVQLRKQTAAATSFGSSYLDVVDISDSFYIQFSGTYRVS